MNTMVSVRVRGIYSTALTSLLLNSGFRIVEASDKVRSRLNIEFDTSPSSVTVKDTDNPDEVLVVGSPADALRVFEVLTAKLRYVVKWASNVDLHGIYSGRVVEKQGDTCIVDIGHDRGYLYPCRESIGEMIVVGVSRTALKPGDRLMLTKSFRVLGKYIAIIHDHPRITFSEHIRDAETRARLSTIAARKLIGTGIGIHFRSNSKYATNEDIENEIDDLLEEYRNILSKAGDMNEPGKIRDGEFIGLIELTSLAKKILDDVRKGATYTIPGHHSLKSLGLSDYVDFLEEVLSDVRTISDDVVKSGLVHYILKKTIEIGRVDFIHVKPTGEALRLTPGQLIKSFHEGEGLTLIIRREIRSNGIYDGLGIEKKPGDIDYVVANTEKPYIIHNYYRGRQWLGTYININTPPEIGPGVIKYHDLIIDVAIYQDGVAKLLDVEEYGEYCEKGIISSELCTLAEETVSNIVKDPSRYVYNPNKNQESY